MTKQEELSKKGWVNQKKTCIVHIQMKDFRDFFCFIQQ